MKNWKQADLARASGLSTASIAQFANNQNPPGKRGCEKIAKALGIPPETVFRAAGLLPPAPQSDPVTDEALYLLRQLPSEDVQEIIDLARVKIARRERNQNAVQKP